MSITVFQHDDKCPPARLGAALRDRGQRLDIIRPDRGESMLPDLHAVDAVISFGGPQVLDKPEDWMHDEMAFLQRAHAARRPIVGVCLGAQLLAAALGGSVAPMPEPELGFHPLKLSPHGRNDSLFAGIAWTTPMFHYHTRHITKLPDDGALLASSALCPIQAFRVGKTTYGFQFHFEAYRETMATFADGSPDRLRATGIDRQEYEKSCDAHRSAFDRIADRMCDNIRRRLIPTDKGQTA
ncbi:MAG: type 1 glutamine amidotransferase [Phycisphaerales bacterium]|nr:type 1 glutamine amidotransferase [Phycisphaerales bacterium]